MYKYIVLCCAFDLNPNWLSRVSKNCCHLVALSAIKILFIDKRNGYKGKTVDDPNIIIIIIKNIAITT